MPNSKSIRAGRAFVELFADDSQLARGLKAAERRLKAWGAGIRSIGAKVFAGGVAFVTPLLLAVKQFASSGDALDKMSSRVGASVEFLSALSHAAQIGGTNIAAMEVGIRRLQRTAFDAERGLSTAKDAFDQLGISVVGADGQLKSTEDLFMESATALSRLTNNTQKAALATVIFGRAGTQLLPMLKEGADGMVAVMEEAQRLGLVMSTQDATAAAQLTDAWTRLTSSLKMAVVRIGGALAPSLTELADGITSLLKPLIDWIKRNKQLVLLAFKTAAMVAAAGAAFMVAGTLLSGFGTALGVVASVITGVGTAFGLIVTAVGALLSPLGLVTAGIVALGAYLIHTSGAGAAALDWLQRKFQSLKEVASQAFGGIADALAAGDLALAARILWLTLKLEWQKGVNALNVVWESVTTYFLSVWTEAVFGAARIATNAWAQLQSGWTETVDFLADAWLVFTTGITKSWHTAVGFIRTAWVRLKSLFDSELDAEAEITRINTEVVQQNNAADAQRDQRIFERDESRRQRLAGIESGRSGALTELEQQRIAAHAARQQRESADLRASEDALRRARDEWQAAIAEAAATRSEPESEAAPSISRQTADSLLGDLQERLAPAKSIDFGLTQAQKQALQLQALGAGAESPEEQTVKELSALKTQQKQQADAALAVAREQLAALRAQPKPATIL